MEIQNPAYNNWFWNDTKIRYDFIKAVSMYDTAIHSKYGTITEGKITLINESGVNVTSPYGDKFIKWHHVLKIIKDL